MPRGFFTIEKWERPPRGGKSQWTVVCHLGAERSLSDAMKQLESLGKPGFYRVVQTQRMVWAETENGKLRLRKWHSASLESLARSAEAFERDGGRYPVEKARELRKRSRRAKSISSRPSH
jgi:hypothetical protein